MDKSGMMVEDERIEYLLERLVGSISREPALRDDLLQEARLHLWRMEIQNPGRSTSWYLQSCRFRIQHYLAAGKSVDSVKRRWQQLLPDLYGGSGHDDALYHGVERDDDAGDDSVHAAGQCGESVDHREYAHRGFGFCARDVRGVRTGSADLGGSQQRKLYDGDDHSGRDHHDIRDQSGAYESSGIPWDESDSDQSADHREFDECGDR